MLTLGQHGCQECFTVCAAPKVLSLPRLHELISRPQGLVRALMECRNRLPPLGQQQHLAVLSRLLQHLRYRSLECERMGGDAKGPISTVMLRRSKISIWARCRLVQYGMCRSVQSSACPRAGDIAMRFLVADRRKRDPPRSVFVRTI